MKYFLPFGLLIWYLVCWRFSLVTVGRAQLPFFDLYRERWKQLRCIPNIQRLTKEDSILWFEYDLCSLQSSEDRDNNTCLFPVSSMSTPLTLLLSLVTTTGVVVSILTILQTTHIGLEPNVKYSLVSLCILEYTSTVFNGLYTYQRKLAERAQQSQV